MGTILVGTASWTDKTLIDSGRFYPSDAKTPEATRTRRRGMRSSSGSCWSETSAVRADRALLRPRLPSAHWRAITTLAATFVNLPSRPSATWKNLPQHDPSAAVRKCVPM
jgi:hypothetical protein